LWKILCLAGFATILAGFGLSLAYEAILRDMFELPYGFFKPVDQAVGIAMLVGLVAFVVGGSRWARAVGTKPILKGALVGASVPAVVLMLWGAYMAMFQGVAFSDGEHGLHVIPGGMILPIIIFGPFVIPPCALIGAIGGAAQLWKAGK
jgi:hypothetical protein